MRMTTRAGLVAASAVLLSGGLAACGDSGSSTTGSTTTGSATTPASTSGGTGGQYQALVPLIDCLRTHGLTLPDHPSLADVRTAYQALPADKQQAVIAACRDLLPPSLMPNRPASPAPSAS